MVDLSGTKCQAGTGASVAQVPEPRRKVSSRCRIHAVKHEPEFHTGISLRSPGAPSQLLEELNGRRPAEIRRATLSGGGSVWIQDIGDPQAEDVSRHRRPSGRGLLWTWAGFLIETHLRTGRPIKELAAAHEVSASWLFKLLRRYRLEGPRARAAFSAAQDLADPHRRPLRGRDRGAAQGARRRRLRRRGRDDPLPPVQRRPTPPSVSTIFRVLKARGFVTPNPKKRPK